MSKEPVKNTDKIIWRRDEDDSYSPSVRVTETGGIGIQVGGHVITKSPESWHELVKQNQRLRELLRQSQEHIEYLRPFASKDDIELYNKISKILQKSEPEHD